MRLARLSRRRLLKYLSQRQVQLSQVESAAAVIVELVKENVGRPHLRADPQAVDEALTKFDLAHPALALLVPELDEILGLELALEDGEPHACRHGAIKCNQVQSSVPTPAGMARRSAQSSNRRSVARPPGARRPDCH
jgi:hypothetical protein